MFESRGFPPWGRTTSSAFKVQRAAGTPEGTALPRLGSNQDLQSQSLPCSPFTPRGIVFPAQDLNLDQPIFGLLCQLS